MTPVACEHATTRRGEPKFCCVLGRAAERHVDMNGFASFIQPEEQHIAIQLENRWHQAASHLFSGLRAKSKMMSSLLLKKVLSFAMS